MRAALAALKRACSSGQTFGKIEMLRMASNTVTVRFDDVQNAMEAMNLCTFPSSSRSRHWISRLTSYEPRGETLLSFSFPEADA